MFENVNFDKNETLKLWKKKKKKKKKKPKNQLEFRTTERKSSGNPVCFVYFFSFGVFWRQKKSACEEFDRENFPGRKISGIRRVPAPVDDV